ncbi:MAG: hypothetical protein IPN67_11975 [Bacteroidales bacterium]|nr:hypothetical protein [Bacteroidales bacterium]
MHSKIKPYKISLITELAEAISSFSITNVASLLSDEGLFSIQNQNFEIVNSDKEAFIGWLNRCYGKFLFRGRFRRRLSFNIVQCLNSVSGKQIIVFDGGRFPLLSKTQTKNEQSGLVIRYDENKITGIEFCYLVMKTEKPFIYEKRYLTPGS